MPTRRAHTGTAWVFCAAALTWLSACAPQAGPSASDPATPELATEPSTVGGSAASTADPRRWPAMTSPIAVDQALEQRISDLLESMTLAEKVGQVVQGDLGSVTPEDVRRYRLGSVLAGGNSDPGGRYNASAAEWLALADAFHQASMDVSGGGKAIPVLLGIDAVHGHNNVVGATLFPHNIGLGAINDPELVRQIARATAVELRVTGFEWTFAPTVTVPRDDRWGRTYEGYSEDPALVSRYATAVVEGLQGRVGESDFLDDYHVVASAKHYIGDGGTFEGHDKGDTRVSESELRDVHGAGHIRALQAGTQTVMASFSSWNGQKMHGNHSLLSAVLKERMGFDGFVVGDWNGHGEVPGCSNESCPQAMLAGLDMYMAPDTWRAVYDNTLAQARSGEIPIARLDDAVRRILRVKFRLGLFEAGLPSQRALGGKFDLLASAEHRELAREAVRRSLVLLKNNGELLPLDPGAQVLVAGDGADDLAKQSGGWTLSWQGSGTQPADFPNAQSIWSGIEVAVSAAGGTAELAVDGRYSTRPSVAIVVFGEDPYAEFIGDLPNLAYRPGDDHDFALLRRLKDEGIPTVAVFLSGRPLWLNREINAADAFIAAWLPGSEGGGIADVLFRGAAGSVAHDFEGRLPFSWPRTPTQAPQNLGQTDYDPQFAVGYGLSYAEGAELEALPEDSGGMDLSPKPQAYFQRGSAATGWGFQVADQGQPAQAVTRLPSAELASGVQISAVDHLAQEDARKLSWSGGTTAAVWLQSEQAVDLRREAAGATHLQVMLRVDVAPQGEVELSLRCADRCAEAQPMDAFLRTLPVAEWVEIGVPLSCFERDGGGLDQVTGLLQLSTDSRFEMALSRVALGDAPERTMNCEQE